VGQCSFGQVRIPEFLLSIDDPRAKHGGALKGCSICGGELDRLNPLRRIGLIVQVSVTESPTVPSWRRRIGAPRRLS
jgi:hypothetical protein